MTVRGWERRSNVYTGKRWRLREKSFFHHRAHGEHRENIFNYNQLSLWALCSLWLIFIFYDFINA